MELENQVGTAVDTTASGTPTASSNDSDFLAGLFDELDNFELDEGTEDIDTSEGQSDDGLDDDGEVEPEGDGKVETPATEPKPEGDKPETFVVKHLGKEVNLSRDEMVVTAQKGLNYDHVVGERNRVSGELDALNAILKPEADKVGMSVSQYLAEWQLQSRVNQIKAQYEASGNPISDVVASDMARLEIAGDRKKAEDKVQQEQLASQKRFEDIKSNILKEAEEVRKANGLEELPQAVIDGIADGKSPREAFLQYKVSEMEKENKILKQNEANKQKSPPKRKKESGVDASDPFLEGLFGR